MADRNRYGDMLREIVLLPVLLISDYAFLSSLSFSWSLDDNGDICDERKPITIESTNIITQTRRTTHSTRSLI